MQTIKQSYDIVLPKGVELTEYLIDQAKQIEACARTCYKSEDKITDDSYIKMLTMLRERNHLAMFEFGGLTVHFVTNRGVTHEFVRHRIPSFAQESTRYCNYAKDKFGNELTIIEPPTWNDFTDKQKEIWTQAIVEAEANYMELIALGQTPQIARGVLPNDLKTEINVKCNFREWLHIFGLRTAPAAHPDIRALLTPLKEPLAAALPCVFG